MDKNRRGFHRLVQRRFKDFPVFSSFLFHFLRTNMDILQACKAC